jgi:hypothetical protein
LRSVCKGGVYTSEQARAPQLLHRPSLPRQSRGWSLRLGAAFDEGSAWVAPVTLANGASAVLKLGMPHMESEHEIEGLRFLGGDPTVRLLDADDDLGAMLLERCEPGTTLRALPEPEQDLVIAGLLRRLHAAGDRPARGECSRRPSGAALQTSSPSRARPPLEAVSLPSSGGIVNRFAAPLLRAQPVRSPVRPQSARVACPAFSPDVDADVCRWGDGLHS